MSSFVTVEREIRAPRAQVLGFVSVAANARHWIWAPAQVATIASERDVPGGIKQLIDGDGNKLRDKVSEAGDEVAVIESELRPRSKDVPGRHLRYEVAVTAGTGTAIAKLSLGFLDRDNPASTVEIRRWRRHATQCLGRLAGACEHDVAE